MSNYLLWIVLSMVTHSPLGAGFAVLAFWWLTDRFTLQILPDPLRAFARWRRVGRLRELIAMNPHDRRSRLELAELLLSQHRPHAALEAVKPNLDAGDRDAITLYTMGLACLGANHFDQGEVFLGAAREAEPGFRLGAIELELGRWRLERGDGLGAREALEKFCATRHGTVEGKVLLARACAATGDAALAKRLKNEAWNDYVASPRFRRRIERWWAWRAKPERPATWAVLVLLVLVIGVRVLVPLGKSLQRPAREAWSDDAGGDGEP